MDSSFFKENFIIAIDEYGEFYSVPKVEGEKNHFQPYRRLNEVLNGIMGEILENDTSFTLPNTLGKLGFINIVPPELDEPIEELTTIFLVFPFDPTEVQLNSLKDLYKHLEKVKNIYFFKKPGVRRRLDFSFIDSGFEKLKTFVEEKLDEIRVKKAENSERSK